MHPEPDRAIAWPPLRQAASILGVAPSTLSRRADLAPLRCGRELRIPPGEMARLARLYMRRPLSEVAIGTLDYARARATGDDGTTETEIRTAFASTPQTGLDPGLFLAEARRALPRRLAEEVERVYRTALPAAETPR